MLGPAPSALVGEGLRPSWARPSTSALTRFGGQVGRRRRLALLGVGELAGRHSRAAGSQALRPFECGREKYCAYFKLVPATVLQTSDADPDEMPATGGSVAPVPTIRRAVPKAH